MVKLAVRMIQTKRIALNDYLLKVVVSFALLFFISNYFSQSTITPEIRAYLFHVVRKSPILEKNFGYAFEYFGPKVSLKDGSMNYDSLETLIVNEPELLVIRSEEIARAPKGLIIELSNKTSVWMLNKTLNAIQTGKNDYHQEIFNEYIRHFSDKLPRQILKSKFYEILFDPKQSPIYNSNLSLYDRCLLLSNIGFKGAEDQIEILKAQHFAINKTIENYCLNLFRNLGGKSTDFENYLLAAGDGSYTSGILAERERDDDGNWNKGLPKAIGLFPYDVVIKDNAIVPERICSRVMETCGEGRQTNLHFDVWGYNFNKQTTVVIEKNGYSYHLFGSDKTRFLSPDSTYGVGSTFQKVINELQSNTFLDLEKQIKGKNGYNEQIAEKNHQLAEVYVYIQEKEASYGELTKKKFITPDNPSRQARKYKKEHENGGPVNITPTTRSKRKARNKRQTDLVDLYQEYEQLEQEKIALEEERKPVLEEYEQKKHVLDNYKRQMGATWMPFKVIDGLYIYEDSTTFDIQTQEFIFPSKNKKESFEIRLISIPEDLVGENSDEVMMHISKVDLEPFYDADIKLDFKDLFDSDAYQLTKNIFLDKDSALLNRFFKQINNKALNFTFEINGNGVGKLKEGELIKDPSPTELRSYPGNSSEEWKVSRQQKEFADLRKTILYLKVDRMVNVKIDSYTDPVQSNLLVKSSRIQELISEGKISKNDALSAYRSLAVLNQLKLELNVQASKHLEPENAKRLIDQMNNAIDKSRVKVGNEYLRIKDFKM